MSSELSVKALYALCQRESHWLCEKTKTFESKKYAIFPAGLTARSFYYKFLNDYGIEAEFFIDNNPALEGKTVCGKPVLARPWESMSDFGTEYVVLIPTLSKYYFPIIKQLEDNGVYSYMHADTFCACRLWDRYACVLNYLYDEKSKLAYLGAVYALLSLDNQFIQYENNHYFALRQFATNGFEIIADIGAYVGDTIEEYVSRSTEGIKVYAFEPYPAAIEKLNARIQRLKNEWFLEDSDIVIVPAGAGNETKKLMFSGANPTMLKLNEHGEMELEIFSLDDYFNDKDPFTILKADIEGGEMDMLKGAIVTIRRHKPKMALSIYHSPEDFARIAEYVRGLVPEYNMAVRNHGPDYMDTMLYCWI